MKSHRTDFQPEVPSRAAPGLMLHVVEMPDGFHVVQIPGEDDAILTHWVGPQVNRTAAEMQRSELTQAATRGDTSGCFSDGARDFFDLAGRIEDFITNYRGDVRSLALALAQEAPWDSKAFPDGPPPI